jgi:hypothetical protein
MARYLKRRRMNRNRIEQIVKELLPASSLYLVFSAPNTMLQFDNADR